MKNLYYLIIGWFLVANLGITSVTSGLAKENEGKSPFKSLQQPIQVPGEKVKIYPNPAKDYLYVQLNLWEGSNPPQHAFEIKIHDILGNTMQVETEEVGNSTYSIHVNDYPTGYYMLTVSCKACNNISDGNTQEGYKKAFKFLKQ